MRKMICFIPVFLCFFCASAQLLSWAPQFSADNSTITFTIDATKGNQGLLGHAGNVYMHLGVITNLSTSQTNWRYVATSWGTTTAPQAAPAGTNKWTFTITNPRAYFNSAAGGVPAGETILRVACLFRDATGAKVQKNSDGTDTYIPIYAAGSNVIQFTQPFILPLYNADNEPITAIVGQSIPLTAVASTSAGSLKLYFNGTQISGPVTSNTTITGNAVVASTGSQQIIAELTLGASSYYDTINFFVTSIASLPPGLKEGINYAADCTGATLVLYAPNKTNVAVIGDFPGSNWVPQPQYQMNKTPDGTTYWLTINGLTPGTEYAFQYLVDNSIYVADPYSEKILDPNNDQYIPPSTYPNLKPYPTNPNVTSAKNGIVSVMQPCEPAYNWKVKNFAKPDKRNLIVYELLLRDFGAAHDYQMLIDTFNYFKRLGVNAIELMPVSEFSGNESWGYNPTFYCALDKYYGTKNKLKEFIDLCHANGIAVILDVVFNQLDAYNAPQGKLYWDAANGRPAANNPWLNQTAPHPYGVFQDLNHTVQATQTLVKNSLEYWLKEYKVDGFRFDLAKGFTQTPTNTGTVEDYDASRVANLNRYFDYITPLYPDTYMILEFLGTQRQEEQEYATKGYLLWGNNNGSYNEATKGFGAGSDFSKVVYNSAACAFTTPSAVGYMESHDEERLMYNNLLSGNNTNAAHNVRTLAIALQRQAAAAAVFFTVPGPKMFWQFGERGYDVSKFFGGSNVANKPPRWEYMADTNRLKLWNAYARLINLRTSNPAVFNNTTFTYNFLDNNGLYKTFQIASPVAAGMKVTVVANLEVVSRSKAITFQTTGSWYNYLSNGTGTGILGPTGSTFNVPTATQTVFLQPGEYHVYVYEPATTYTFTGNGNWNVASNWSYSKIPPQPLTSGSEIVINNMPGGECVLTQLQTISTGAKLTVMPGKNLRIPLYLTIQ